MPTKVKESNLNLVDADLTMKTLTTTEGLTVGNTAINDLKEISDTAAEQATALAIALG